MIYIYNVYTIRYIYYECVRHVIDLLIDRITLHIDKYANMQRINITQTEVGIWKQSYDDDDDDGDNKDQ